MTTSDSAKPEIRASVALPGSAKDYGRTQIDEAVKARMRERWRALWGRDPIAMVPQARMRADKDPLDIYREADACVCDFTRFENEVVLWTEM